MRSLLVAAVSDHCAQDGSNHKPLRHQYLGSVACSMRRLWVADVSDHCAQDGSGIPCNSHELPGGGMGHCFGLLRLQ